MLPNYVVEMFDWYFLPNVHNIRDYSFILVQWSGFFLLRHSRMQVSGESYLAPFHSMLPENSLFILSFN